MDDKQHFELIFHSFLALKLCNQPLKSFYLQISMVSKSNARKNVH